MAAQPATKNTRKPRPATKTRKPTAAQERAAAEKAAKRAEITAMLAQAEESFEYDEENPAMVRAFESLTAHYSEGNALLILAQATALGLRVRGLNDVGGFGAFQERGRSIKAGEHKSIFIWARAAKKDETPEAQPTTTTGETKDRQFFFPIGIFHVSQTEDKAKADARRDAAKSAS